MKNIWQITVRLCQKFALTPEQADHLAKIKFPCC